ncbi:hypothetical protein FACS1894211_02150 [Clostridia bacterium]|nr:hypothetical protein FACS1894211_02150 [Clostridia bacterium]
MRKHKEIKTITAKIYNTENIVFKYIAIAPKIVNIIDATITYKNCKSQRLFRSFINSNAGALYIFSLIIEMEIDIIVIQKIEIEDTSEIKASRKSLS